jgi:GrpB-like predicted nucleotidyltransferase (UPF0157 family)
VPGRSHDESLEQRLQRVLRDEVAIAPYDPAWPETFGQEKAHLLACLPEDLVRRVEHFGSTAVPGLAAKPIVDVLVEVTDLEATRSRIAPLLEAQGYDYFWRPTHGDDGPPYYCWFIKRAAATGVRTHHVHMVERSFAEHWDRLFFRDYLIEHPEAAREYEALKRRLAAESPNDRVAYTRGKTAFILAVTERAKRRYGAKAEQVRVLDRAAGRIVERLAPITRVEDALDLVACCVEHGSTRLLLEAGVLPEAFFELRTRFAGELLQKLQNYRIRVAAVFPPDPGPGERFAEFVAEARRGCDFHAFTRREEAEAWLASV